jgi:hypothetical protein
MVVTDDALKSVGRVGEFEFDIRRAEDSPETRRRWDRRAEALAALLLAEWERERGKEALN